MQEIFLSFLILDKKSDPLGHPAILICNGVFLTTVESLHNGHLGRTLGIEESGRCIEMAGVFCGTPNAEYRTPNDSRI